MEHPISPNELDSPNEWSPVETSQSTEPVEESAATPNALDVQKRPAMIIRNKEFYFEDVVILVSMISKESSNPLINVISRLKTNCSAYLVETLSRSQMYFAINFMYPIQKAREAASTMIQ